jgi:hypothetical protein
MLCALDGAEPSEGDIADYAEEVAALSGRGARFLEIHLYTQARPSPEGRTESLPDGFLLRAARLLAERLPGLSVRTFGAGGEIRR